MALEKLRSSWERMVDPVIDSISTWKPSTLTWIALPIGVLGGLSVLMAPNNTYGASMLFGGALLIGFAMVLDALDGPLARRTGQVTRWGDYLDHTFDRLLDIIWTVCLAGSVFVGDFTFGLLAALFTLLGSYMGTQAQAVAGTRNYRGFSRADRTILALVALVMMGVFIHLEIGDFGTFPGALDHIGVNPVSIAVVISAFGGLWTFLIRFVQAKHEISQIDRDDPLPQPNQGNESE